MEKFTPTANRKRATATGNAATNVKKFTPTAARTRDMSIVEERAGNLINKLAKQYMDASRLSRSISKDDYIKSIGLDETDFQYDTLEKYDAEIAASRPIAYARDINRNVNPIKFGAQKRQAAAESLVPDRLKGRQKEIQLTGPSVPVEYAEMASKASDTRIDRLNHERTLLEQKQTIDDYNRLSENADFAENSKFDPHSADFVDLLVNYGFGDDINCANAYGKFRSRYGLSDVEIQRLLTNNTPTTSYFDKGYQYLSDNELSIYNYLNNTAGKDAAQKYIAALGTVLSKRRSVDKYLEKQDEYREDSFIEKGVHQLMTPVTMLVGNVKSAVSDAATGITGNYNPYSSGHDITNTTQAIIGATSQDIIDAIDSAVGSETVGRLASVAYQSTIQSASSALGAAMLGKGYLAVAGAGAASQKAKELYERGATGRQIFNGGVITGLIEAALEYLPLEALFDTAKSMSKSPKNWKGIINALFRDDKFWKSIGKNSAINFTEEGLTDLSNIVSDCIMMGEDSELSILQQQYMEDGESREDAYKHALRDKAQDVAWSAVGGAFGGASSSVMFSAAGYAQYNAEVGRIGQSYIDGTDGHSVDEAISIGLDNAHTTEAYKLADAIHKKVQSGQSVTAHEVGRMLVESSSAESAKARAIDHAVRESARQHGVSENIAEDVANIAAATGRTIEFADDAEFGMALEGDAVVAGSYDPSTGVIKVNAAASSEDITSFLIKHELTHSVEGTEQYDQLTDIVQAQMGDDAFSDAVAQVMEQRAASGQPIDVTAAEQEVVADWVGDNLYKGGFAKAIVDGNATVGNAFVRTIDKLRLALGNKKSRANTQLKVVERLFMRALEQDIKLRDGDAENLIVTMTDGKQYVRADRQVIHGNNPRQWAEQVKNYIDTTIRSGEDVIVYAADGDALTITEDTSGKARFRNDIRLPDGTTRPMTDEEYAVKLRAETHIDELAAVSTHGKRTVPDYKNHDFARDGFNYRTAYFMDHDGQYYRLTISVGKNGLVNTVYNVGKIKEAKYSLSGSKAASQSDAVRSASNTNIAENANGVNTQSMQGDEKNTPKSQNAVVSRAWLQGDTTVDRAGNPVETPAHSDAAVAETPVRSQVQNGEPSTVIDLSTDSDLAQRVEGLHGAEKYKKIQQYILEVLNDQPITLSDGKQAIVDKSDALHIASNAAQKKTAQIAQIKELIESAKLYAEDNNVEHNKFDYFCYYKANVQYNGEEFPLYINVGRGKTDKQYHIYDITNKLRDTADRINGLERPKPNEGYALTNGVSTHSIPETLPIVKPNSVNYEALRTAVTVNDVIDAVGDSEAFRRAYLASQVDRVRGTVDVDGQTMSADEYMSQEYHALPDDETTIRDAIAQTESALADELRRAALDGVDESPTLLKLNIQLFAQKAKLEYILDKGEEGSKTRRFFEQRLKGKDANHNQELVDLLAGRNETYNPIANEKTLDKANARLRDAKYSKDLRRRILRYNPQDLFSDVDMAAAQVMINDAINDGDLSTAADLIQGVSRKGTELGRAVQIMSMQARLTPEGTLRAMQRTLQKTADKVIGEGASDSIDQVVDEIIEKIETLGGQRTEKDGKGGNTPADISGATRKQLRDALVEDLAATDGNYLSKDDIGKLLDKVIDESTNIPEQVRRYIKKHIKTGTLAERLYEMQQKGHLNNSTLRRAMEEALGLPTLSESEIATVVDLATRIHALDVDPVQQAEVMDELYDMLGRKLPVTAWEAISNWRKFGMLFNVKTHLRNIASNAAYSGVRKADDITAMMVERMFVRDSSQWSKKLGWRKTEDGQALLPKIEKSAELALLQMQKRGKYEYGGSPLENHRNLFGTSKLAETKFGKTADKASRWNSELLEREDVWFFKPAYVDALGQIMTARHMTEVTPEVEAMAYQRALEATFRADNAISDFVSLLKRRGGKFKNFGAAMTDIAIPFNKTPANIATQSAMHSPIGLVKGAFDLYNATKGKGTKTVADAINTMAKGTTGTALLIIGALLGSIGHFNTGFGKTEKERAADELAGIQENAFVVGGVSISVDWLQPAAAPLIIGASMAERLQDEGLTLGTVFGSLMDGTDALFDMSMMQSMYDLFGGYDTGATATLGSVAENLVSQSIPTLVGQAARSIDPVQRKTKGDTDFETMINKILAKIPGLTYLLDPELDVWGEEVHRTGKATEWSWALNFLQQFALPFNTKLGTGTDAVSREIQRLYDAEGSAAIPTAITRDEARDAGIDYVESNRALGAVNRQAVEDFVNNKWPYTVQEELPNGKRRNVTKFYEDMTDEERVRVLKRIYKKAKEQVTEADEANDAYFADIMRRLG